MRRRALDLLACPGCRAPSLRLAAVEERDGHVLTGTLTCDCGLTYPVTGGVPRMLPQAASDPLARLKQKTIENFGFEWTEWGRYGWSDGAAPTEIERDTFHRKTLLAPNDLRGKVALDAGCGNGRYSYWASEHAADVIAVDLGPGVDSAFRNLATRPNVHVVQGDLFNPPIRTHAVEVVFSIGVLMHTGDARRATERLAELLAPGGSLTVHLYHKGNFVYEVNDAMLRSLTTRLSIPWLQQLSGGLARVGEYLERRGLFGYANQLMRLHTDATGNFDWYAAPIATHHTYPEVFGWFAKLGLDVIGDNRAPGSAPHGLRRRMGRLFWREWALTVRGRKRS